MYAFVRQCLEHQENPFALCEHLQCFLPTISDISPPVQIISETQDSFIKLRLVPAALIHFKWKDQGSEYDLLLFLYTALASYPFLNSSLMSNLKAKMPPDWSYDTEIARLHVLRTSAQQQAPSSDLNSTETTKFSTTTPECTECSTEGTVRCEGCAQVFCGPCFTKIHAPGSDMASHVSRPIGGMHNYLVS